MRDTLPAKRYVTSCVVCGGLFTTLRRDAVTCGPACRTRGHRTGRIREAAEWVHQTAGEDVPLSTFQRAQAVHSLLPDRTRELIAGTLELDAPELRAEMGKAYEELVRRAVQRACAGQSGP